MMDLYFLTGFIGILVGILICWIVVHEKGLDKDKEFELNHKISHLEDEKRELESDLSREKINSTHLQDSLTDKNHTNKQLIRIIKELGYEIEYCQWGFNLKKIKENDDNG